MIVAGGEEPNTDFLRKVLEEAQEFWCADKGLCLCHPLGLVPSLLIGDLDSVNEAQVSVVSAAGGEVLRYPPEKDESDLELALREAHRRGYRGVTFLGMAGGRLDHSLFNLLAILGLAQQMGISARALSSHSEVHLLLPGSHNFTRTRGSICSLLPLSDRVENVSLRGLRYPLENETLDWTSTRGLSNLMTEDNFNVTLTAGRLLLILPN